MDKAGCSQVGRLFARLRQLQVMPEMSAMNWVFVCDIHEPEMIN
jgi:hypothetical protein